jgi:hypothetical protein
MLQSIFDQSGIIQNPSLLLLSKERNCKKESTNATISLMRIYCLQSYAVLTSLQSLFCDAFRGSILSFWLGKYSRLCHRGYESGYY